MSRNPSLDSGGGGGNGSGYSNAGGGGSATNEQAQIIKQIIPTSTNLPSGSETIVSSLNELYYLLANGATSSINLSASAGGGGVGGGIVFVSAQTLANNRTIRANGNNGGNGGNGYVNAFPGGGGGGGGVVILFYKTFINLVLLQLTAGLVVLVVRLAEALVRLALLGKFIER